MIKKLFISLWFALAILFSLTISPSGILAQNYTVPEQNALNQNTTPFVKQVQAGSYEVSWWMLVIPIVLLSVAYIVFRTADEMAGRNEFAYHDIDLTQKDKDEKKEKEKPKPLKNKILHKLG